MMVRIHAKQVMCIRVFWLRCALGSGRLWLGSRPKERVGIWNLGVSTHASQTDDLGARKEGGICIRDAMDRVDFIVNVRSHKILAPDRLTKRRTEWRCVAQRCVELDLGVLDSTQNRTWRGKTQYQGLDRQVGLGEVQGDTLLV